MKLVSTNPSDGYSVLGEVEVSTQQDVDIAVTSARSALAEWADVSLSERISHLQSLTAEIEKRSHDLSEIVALETGRPLNALKTHTKVTVDYWNGYFAQAAEALADVETARTDAERHVVIREPRGVIAAICPWNYPLLNIAWQCGQALIAGNTIVYKNSEENPLFAELMREVFAASSVPDGVFNILQGDGSVGQMMIDADVDAISFTGSSATGAKIAQRAAARLVPFVAELGGSSPGIVFEDFDVEDKASDLFWLRFYHSGQICASIKRLIVHESKYDQTVDALRAVAEKTIIGPAVDAQTELGPLVAKRQLEKIESQVNDSVAAGAKVATGGERPDALNGAYYEPTLLTNVDRNMRVWREETFGPVLPIVSFKTEQEAIELANDTEYGLNAYVLTDDSERFARVAKQIEAGAVVQNFGNYDHPASPFGGYKKSGIGRTGGVFGFHEVTQPKLVSCEL